MIDRETVGHRGTPVGTVDMVLDNRVLRFRSRRAIEVHDGLQIDIPGEAKPFGFPVDALRLAGEYAHTFEAPAHTSVEVILPEEHPEIPARRDGLSCLLAGSETALSIRSPQAGRVSSAPAAGRIDRPCAGPADRACAGRAGTRNRGHDCRAHSSPQRMPGKQKHLCAARLRSSATHDSRQASSSFNNPDGLFVPVSQMNELRRRITANVEKQLATKSALRIRHIQDDLSSPHASSTIPHPSFHWSLKVDRIGLLSDFEDEDWKDLDEVIVEITEDPVDVLKSRLRQLPRNQVRLALPMITRTWEEQDLSDKILELHSAGWTRWEATNVSAWKMLPFRLGTWNLEPGT